MIVLVLSDDKVVDSRLGFQLSMQLAFNSLRSNLQTVAWAVVALKGLQGKILRL